MASQTDICNIASSLLGVNPIVSINDGTTQANAYLSVWDTQRDSELRINVWNFAKARASLPAMATVPLSGPYTQQYQMPQQCLRILMMGDAYPAVDLSDYRSGPTTDDWVIEGGLILSNLPAPLSIAYIQQVTDPTRFDASFAFMMACRLAGTTCFRLTNSNSMKQDVMAEYKQARKDALRSGAMELPPVVLADDSWVSARLADGGSLASVNF